MVRPGFVIPLLLVPALAVPGDPAAPSDDDILKAFKAACLGTEGTRPWEARTAPLSKADAASWRERLWKASKEAAKKPLPKDPVIQAGGRTMRYAVKIVGKQKPAKGWPLYLCLHGGGEDKATNDEAWERMQTRYVEGVKEGLVLAPRSPVDLSASWSASWIPPLMDALIRECVALRDVDPDRVYLLGYSMGAEGALHLGPVMADRWAAVSASACGGNPLGSPPANLRNVPVLMQIGQQDAPHYPAAKAFSDALKDLLRDDPRGYVLDYREYKDLGHQIQDQKISSAWAGAQVRNPIPDRIAWGAQRGFRIRIDGEWKDASYVSKRLYWLEAEPAGSWKKVVAEREGNTIRILDAEGVKRLTIHLDDRMMDLDKPVRVVRGDRELFQGLVPRTLSAIASTLLDRGDPRLAFSARIEVAP